MASNTWQHELAPLGVRTITLITCGVKSKAYDNVDAPRLPANSHYLVIRDYLEGLADGGQMHSDAMDAHRYARDVVRAVHRGVEGEVWAGKSALVARLGCWLFPRSILVSCLSLFLLTFWLVAATLLVAILSYVWLSVRSLN